MLTRPWPIPVHSPSCDDVRALGFWHVFKEEGQPITGASFAPA